MKNLFLIGSMLLFFSYASAQDNPAKTKQSATQTDSVHSKKTKKTNASTSTTQKSDAAAQGNKQKKSKMKSSGAGTTQQNDSVNKTGRP